MVAHTVDAQTIGAQITELKYETDTTINSPYKHSDKPIKSYQIFNTADAALRKRNLDLILNLYDSLIAGVGGFNLANHSLIANGNYNQNWNYHQLIIANISNLELRDTFSDIINTFDSLVTLGKSTTGIIVDRKLGSVMIDSSYYLPTSAGAAIDDVLQTTSTYGTGWLPITHIGLITKYNGATTAGNGLSVVMASSQQVNKTSTTVLTTYVPSINGDFVISGYLGVNSISSGSITYEVTWTDLHSVVQQFTFSIATGTGIQNVYNQQIQVLSGTTITVAIVFAGGTTASCDASATISKVN